MPGHDEAPILQFDRMEKADRELFPDGLYVAVSRVEDLYVVQSWRPSRVLLSYTRAVGNRLLETEGQPIPFSKGELVLVLDPYFPQREDERLSADIPRLLEAGYRQFVVNNLGHLAFFRGTEAKIIAGPYLYTFNSWAYSFVNALGLTNIITPLENGRQNLDRTVDAQRRPGTFVTIFAYAALFRIRGNLSSMYDFSDFSDGRGENFQLISSDDGSLVVPEKPFSIVDKIPFLKEAGFSKFIIDFSGPQLKKRDYKDVIDAAKAGAPLPFTTRFNWKDGFFATAEGSSGGKPRRSDDDEGAGKRRPSGGGQRGGPARGKRR
jgi:U32 family peptidase